MIYRYIAYDADGNVIEGTIEAATEALARQTLRRSGHRLLVLRRGRTRPNLRELFPSLFGIRSRDVIIFSRLLATLLERGTTVIAALQLLREQTRNSTLREVIGSMVQDLSQGHSFSEAVGRHPQAFPLVYRRTVNIAEQTGNLEAVLRQMADYMERESAALARVTKALTYPALVLLVAAGVIIMLLTVVLPSLVGVFADLGAELPLPTRLLMGITGFLASYKLYLLAAAFGTGVLGFWYLRTPGGRKARDGLLLRIPVIGRVNALREMSHFSRTTSILLEAGLPMTEAMDLVIQTTRNEVVRDALEGVKDGILRGRGLSRPMAENPLFPRLLVQMVRVGEEVGTLSTDLMVVTDLYAQETDERVGTLLRLLEPSMFLVLGALVAFIAVSVIMPIYTVMGAVE